MKIKNTNKFFSDDFLREAIRFTRPAGISKFTVHLKNSQKGYGGMAYYAGCSYGKSVGALVVVRVGNLKYPHRSICRRGGYLPVTTYSREETLIHLLAHELRHLWQAKHPRGWRVWGARGQFSERDADAYAIRKVREWRKR